eukprot:424311-Amphidinium_carterae.3
MPLEHFVSAEHTISAACTFQLNCKDERAGLTGNNDSKWAAWKQKGVGLNKCCHKLNHPKLHNSKSLGLKSMETTSNNNF